MTTKEAAAHYEAEHVARYNNRPVAMYNPHDKPVSELPIIYGHNNTKSDDGTSYFLNGRIIAEDGTYLGGHACSSEAYMLNDLGILEGCRLDRHESFRAHYPNGYRMEFVSWRDVAAHEGLLLAYAANDELREAACARADTTPALCAEPPDTDYIIRDVECKMDAEGEE